MLNRVVLMGRLVREPELRYTTSNTPVTSFTIANERDFKGNDGEKVTDFIDCVAWRGTAEFVGKYFSKGRMIVVDGRLQTRKWEDKDHNKRTSVEVIADSVYFGDSKRDGDEPRTKDYPVPTAGPTDGLTATPGGVFVEMDDDEGELPF